MLGALDVDGASGTVSRLGILHPLLAALIIPILQVGKGGSEI